MYAQPGRERERESRGETASFSFATAHILLSRGLIKKSARIGNDFYVLVFSLTAPLYFVSHHPLPWRKESKRRK
jgi:hypothetical protein